MAEASTRAVRRLPRAAARRPRPDRRARPRTRPQAPGRRRDPPPRRAVDPAGARAPRPVDLRAERQGNAPPTRRRRILRPALLTTVQVHALGKSLSPLRCEGKAPHAESARLRAAGKRRHLPRSHMPRRIGEPILTAAYRAYRDENLTYKQTAELGLRAHPAPPAADLRSRTRSADRSPRRRLYQPATEPGDRQHERIRAAHRPARGREPQAPRATRPASCRQVRRPPRGCQSRPKTTARRS